MSPLPVVALSQSKSASTIASGHFLATPEFTPFSAFVIFALPATAASMAVASSAAFTTGGVDFFPFRAALFALFASAPQVSASLSWRFDTSD